MGRQTSINSTKSIIPIEEFEKMQKAY